MKRLTITSNILLTLGIPFAIILTSVFLATNPQLFTSNESTMFNAITLDLVFTSPILYFLLIRKKKISKFTVMPFFVAGLVISTLVIPESHQYALNQIKTWFLPIVELTVFSVVVYQIRRVRKAVKASQAEEPDFLAALRKGASSVFPEKLAQILTIEIGMFYYAFIAWKKTTYKPHEFSYHKESGLQGLLGAFLAVVCIELFATHLLLMNSYPTLSWVLSILSLYSAIQIFGLIKSIPRTPARIENDELLLRMGIFKEVRVKIDQIETIELTMADYPKEDKLYQKIALFDHNCIIHLKEKETITGLFGLKKEAQHLILNIDEKERFKQVLTHEIQIRETHQ